MPSRLRMSGISEATGMSSSSVMRMACDSSMAAARLASCWSSSPNSATNKATSSLEPCLQTNKKPMLGTHDSRELKQPSHVVRTQATCKLPLICMQHDAQTHIHTLCSKRGRCINNKHAIQHTSTASNLPLSDLEQCQELHPPDS